MRSAASRKVTSTKASTSTPQLDQTPPSYYTNDEDAIEAGTELEEKGERFAIGWKAQKYFEKSLEVYKRAINLNSKNQDAPYNAARVLFLLATGFYQPPKSIEALHESAILYRQSLILTSPVDASDGSPSAFHLDVQFNLAVTLLTLSDQLEHNKELSSTRIALIEEAVKLFTDVIDGQEMVLQKQKMEEQGFSRSEDDTIVEENMTPTDGSSQIRSEYTTSLITPSSALETLHNLHSSGLAALDLAEDRISIVNAVSLSSSSIRRAHSIIAAFPDGETRSPDGEWIENVSSFRYAQLEIELTEATHRTAKNIDSNEIRADLVSVGRKALQEANIILDIDGSGFELSTTKGRALHRIHLQQIEQLGDLLVTQARASMTCLLPFPNGTSFGYSIWEELWTASKLYLAALKAIDTTGAATTTSSAILGNTNASTTTSRKRCSLYTSLSAISILRNENHLWQSMNKVDFKMREQLVNNGRIYARKAIAEIGLGWLLKVCGADNARYELPHGGLESLQEEADAILILLRALHTRSKWTGGTSNLQEADIICANTRQGLLQGEHSESWKRILFSQQGASNGHGFIEQIVAEEGFAFVNGLEYEFWSQVESKLIS